MTVDVETGSKAGVKTVAVTTGSNTKEELTAGKPFRIVEKVSQVAQIVEELSSRESSPAAQENNSC